MKHLYFLLLFIFITPYYAQTSASTLVHLEDSVSTSPPNSITRGMVQDKNRNIWLATWQGIARYDGKVFRKFNSKEDPFRACAVLEDKKGNLWFGTIGGGLYYYPADRDSSTIKTFTHFKMSDGLASNTIFCVLEDKAGTIWFGTDNGVSCYTPSVINAGGKLFTNYTITDGLIHNSVFCIVQDNSGILWFGTVEGTWRYNGKSFY